MTSPDDLQLAVQRTLGGLEAKLDSLSEKIDTVLGLTQRVESLERWKAWTLGAGAAGGMLVVVLWNFLTATTGHVR